jgi:hypothetical protein
VAVLLLMLLFFTCHCLPAVAGVARQPVIIVLLSWFYAMERAEQTRQVDLGYCHCAADSLARRVLRSFSARWARLPTAQSP